MKFLFQTARADKGSASIEFILTLPVIFCLFMVCFERYQYFVAENTCDDLAFKAADWLTSHSLDKKNFEELTQFLSLSGREINFAQKGIMTATQAKLPEFKVINQFSSSAHVKPIGEDLRKIITRPLKGIPSLVNVQILYNYKPFFKFPKLWEERLIQKMTYVGVNL